MKSEAFFDHVHELWDAGLDPLDDEAVVEHLLATPADAERFAAIQGRLDALRIHAAELQPRGPRQRRRRRSARRVVVAAAALVALAAWGLSAWWRPDSAEADRGESVAGAVPLSWPAPRISAQGRILRFVVRAPATRNRPDACSEVFGSRQTPSMRIALEQRPTSSFEQLSSVADDDQPVLRLAFATLEVAATRVSHHRVNAR